MDKILTIIVPAYNMEKYLDRCLSSLIVSEVLMSRFEVLVINDGSKDKTSEIAHQYEQDFPETFRAIDKDNGHYGSCINRGLAEAKGTFIKVLDADDAFDNQFFREYLEYLGTDIIHERADVIISDYSEVSTKGILISTISYSRHNQAFSKKELTPNDIMAWFIHGLTYRTTMLQKHNYRQTEGVSYTDLEWSYIPMAWASTLFSFDRPLYLYSKGIENQSVSYSIHAKNLWMEIVVLKRILSYYRNVTCSSAKNKDSFLQDRLIIIIEQFYQLCLLTLRKYNPPLESLRDLDFCFKTTCPEEYSITNRYITRIAGLKFYPIRTWRGNMRIALTVQNTIYDLADWFNNFRVKH